MNKSALVLFTVYLFTFCHLAPAFENWEVEENSAENLAEYRPYLRQKRFLPILIAIGTGLFTGVASGVINNAIQGGRWGRSVDDDNAQMINKMINYDLQGAMDLKNTLMEMDSSVGEMIEVNPEGFLCDTTFCSSRSGLYGLGLCTSHVCLCTSGRAKPQECTHGRVFDPSNANCNYPKNLKVCGY